MSQMNVNFIFFWNHTKITFQYLIFFFLKG
jgi:hypothetical protein